METFTDVTMTLEDGVARISINRPDTLNSIRVNTYWELISALRSADESSECHLILLGSTGGKFTAGNDLGDLVDADPKEVMAGVEGIFNTVANLQKVLIAAVEGIAVGIGTTLLLHCDIVVASRKTRFRLPFVNLGVCPEGASSVLLPEAVGQKIARELLLTGRFFTADEALEWGLINAITDPGKTDEVAQEYIMQLLQQPLRSLTETKKLMKTSHAGVDKIVSSELQAFSRLLELDETRMRIMALLN